MARAEIAHVSAANSPAGTPVNGRVPSPMFRNRIALQYQVSPDAAMLSFDGFNVQAFRPPIVAVWCHFRIE
jgi:hypothetical protein